MTFRSQGSKALRAYNQYYIFHCHLHSYCKWLVSKIITGCIRNLGFAILLPVLGGTPFALPPFTQAPVVLMTPQQQILFTPQLNSSFFFFYFLTISYLFTCESCKKMCKRKMLTTVADELFVQAPACIQKRNIISAAWEIRSSLTSVVKALQAAIS